MMDEIANLLDKQKVRYIRIDGSTSSDARKVLVDNFQATDAIRVALLSITAANAGKWAREGSALYQYQSQVAGGQRVLKEKPFVNSKSSVC